jgi:DNA-binding NarL/FixJ family response regulator
MLTMHEDSELLQECLRLGANGYIIKRAAESELIDAIYAVQRGMVYVHPSMIQSLVAVPKKTKTKYSEPETLTHREIEVILLIVEGNTNRQISETLNISIRTVETHRSNIMDKLNLHSRVELVRYVNEHNLSNLH